MAKSNIDEKALQESISRGIPKPMGYTPPTYEPSKVENKEDEIAERKIETSKKAIKLKNEIYINTYLSKKDFTNRQLIYVSKDTHKRLSNFVTIVGGEGVTLSSFVESILRNHLDENKDLINSLFKANLEYPAE